MGDLLSLFGEGDALSLFDVDQHAPRVATSPAGTGATTRDELGELALVVDLNTWAGRVADVNAHLADVGEQLEHDAHDAHDAQAVDHHPDCDGWRYAHRSSLYVGGRDMHGTYSHASCDEPGCGWEFPSAGGYAPSARVVAAADEHRGAMVECDGRCKDWE